jgi:hypothetical protein
MFGNIQLHQTCCKIRLKAAEIPEWQSLWFLEFRSLKAFINENFRHLEFLFCNSSTLNNRANIKKVPLRVLFLVWEPIVANLPEYGFRSLMNPQPNSSVARSLSNFVVDACRCDRSKTAQQATPDQSSPSPNPCRNPSTYSLPAQRIPIFLRNHRGHRGHSRERRDR